MARNHLPGGADLEPSAGRCSPRRRCDGVGFGLGFAVVHDPVAFTVPRQPRRVQLGRGGQHRVLRRPGRGAHRRLLHPAAALEHLSRSAASSASSSGRRSSDEPPADPHRGPRARRRDRRTRDRRAGRGDGAAAARLPGLAQAVALPGAGAARRGLPHRRPRSPRLRRVRLAERRPRLPPHRERHGHGRRPRRARGGAGARRLPRLRRRGRLAARRVATRPRRPPGGAVRRTSEQRPASRRSSSGRSSGTCCCSSSRASPRSC